MNTELMKPEDLTPHPMNYRVHPPEQIRHLAKSIQDNGLYRHVVIAEDNTILAGHGVWQACQFLGMTEIPVYRLPLSPDSPQALKVLTGDNGIGVLAVQDDWALAQLLQDIQGVDDLLGTGFNENSLADLLFHSRPEDDEEGDDVQSIWNEMPEFSQDEIAPYHSLKVHFKTASDLLAFAELMGQTVTNKTAWIYYPKQVGEDLKKIGMKASSNGNHD